MRVFLSHSSKDDSVVQEIRQALESLDVAVWDDSHDLAAGGRLRRAVTSAINECSHFIAVLSLSAANSAWVRKEIAFGLKQGKKVIPLMLTGIEPAALPLWFGEEPVGIKLAVGAGGVAAVLPDLLAALGLALPAGTSAANHVAIVPVADLILELALPAIELADGKRRATATATLRFHPADGRPEVESKRYRFAAPLGPIESEELAWYLERYWNWPAGIFLERARRVEAALPEWGRELYNSLNANPARAAVEAWRATPGDVERRFTIKLDKELVEGATEAQQAEADEAGTLLLGLPWELIRDEQGFLFQGAHGVRVRRSLPNRFPQEALVTAPPIRVLMVSPRPDEAGYIDHRASALPLAEALTKLGDLAEFKLLQPPTFPALEEELAHGRYHVVHFDGHGVYDSEKGLGALSFEDPADRRKTAQITADKIAEVVRGHRVPLFFLDACQSAMAADDPSASVAGMLLECGVASVVAMSHTVLVETARRFVGVFYRELMGGTRVGRAMLAGQRALQQDSFRGNVLNVELRLQDWFVPVLFQEAEDPQLIHAVPDDRMRAVMAKQQELAVGALPPPPGHGFIERSREMLAAERMLAKERYVVLKGEGGEGKTTLAAELARWLLLTRRTARVAFVAFDKIADARAALYSIGEQLVPDYLSQAGQDEQMPMQLVERALAERTTLLVLDNMESILAPPAGSPAHLSFEPEVLNTVLRLAARLAKIGQTRIVFTSREALPEPFQSYPVTIGRLARTEAIRLVSRILGDGNWMPGAVDAGESDREIEELVDAAGCHARALVLLAGEVKGSGVRGATGKLQELMRSLDAKNPGDRELSLLASVRLSLDRLPAGVREKIRPLAVFQGGVNLVSAMVILKLPEPNECLALLRTLTAVGLAEELPFGYFRFDPALAVALLADMTPEEVEPAREAWAEAMVQAIYFLYEQQFKNANFAFNVTRLDLTNLVAALDYRVRTVPDDEAVTLATRLESLVSRIGYPRALSVVSEIRAHFTPGIGEWGHSQYLVESTAVNRLLEKGRYEEGLEAAAALLQKASAVPVDAYPHAAFDLAQAHAYMGRALEMIGRAQDALPFLEEARKQFQKIGEVRMAYVSRGEQGDCLRGLGRYEDAAEAYTEAIQAAEKAEDARNVAVYRTQLGTTRLLQKNYADALQLYIAARDALILFGEQASVAKLWHQIGMTYEGTRHYDEAEKAYQESLKIKIALGDRAHEATTLNQLGSLYSSRKRHAEAVRFYRQAADIFKEFGDFIKEGLTRSNAADELIQLQLYTEARQELVRAMECKRPFGHAAEPWKTFNTLSALERAVGDTAAAENARGQAIDAYVAYRSAGGENQSPMRNMYALTATNPSKAIEAIAQLAANPALPQYITPLLPKLQAIAGGSRDLSLIADPALDYDDAAELFLLLVYLKQAETSEAKPGEEAAGQAAN